MDSPSVHLDALRGIAAFFVLLFHWRSAFFLNYSDISHSNSLLNAVYLVTGIGHQWVIVFFVMSGYLVGGSVLRSVKGGYWSWSGYLVTRLTRLYAVLLPALLLGGVADWSGMHPLGATSFYNGHTGMGSQHFDIHQTLTLPVLAGNAFFLQTIKLPGMSGNPLPTFGTNEALWSLSNEFWYYIAFPMLVLAITKTQRWLLRAGYITALTGLIWFVGYHITVLGIPWLMGVWIPYLPAIPFRGAWMRGAFITAALAIFAAGMILARFHEGLRSDLLLGMIVTLLIWVILQCATSPLPRSYTWLAQRSAHSSYTLYLTHIPALILIRAAMNLPQAYPDSHSLLIGVAALAIVIAYSQLVYELFEKNTGKLRKWIKMHEAAWMRRWSSTR